MEAPGDGLGGCARPRGAPSGTPRARRLAAATPGLQRRRPGWRHRARAGRRRSRRRGTCPGHPPPRPRPPVASTRRRARGTGPTRRTPPPAGWAEGRRPRGGGPRRRTPASSPAAGRAGATPSRPGSHAASAVAPAASPAARAASTSSRLSAASPIATPSGCQSWRRQSTTERAGAVSRMPRCSVTWAASTSPRCSRNQSWARLVRSGGGVGDSPNSVRWTRRGGRHGVGRPQSTAALTWLATAPGTPRAAACASDSCRSHGEVRSQAGATAYRPRCSRVTSPRRASPASSCLVRPAARASERQNGWGSGGRCHAASVVLWPGADVGAASPVDAGASPPPLWTPQHRRLAHQAARYRQNGGSARPRSQGVGRSGGGGCRISRSGRRCSPRWPSRSGC